MNKTKNLITDIMSHVNRLQLCIYLQYLKLDSLWYRFEWTNMRRRE